MTAVAAAAAAVAAAAVGVWGGGQDSITLSLAEWAPRQSPRPAARKVSHACSFTQKRP